MDQHALRALEYRCIQEEPPWCTAACPLHVDVRTFADHMSRDCREGAWKVLRKHMPLPGILGRICDAPCEKHCKRGEVDDTIRIGLLERACVQTDPPPFRVLPLPGKSSKVAVAGGGLSSLTAAWDLARKGYAVTVFEAADVPGSGVRIFDPQQLPPDAVDGEIALLTRLGIRFELGTDPDTPEIAARCRNEFDAVYLGLDTVAGRGWDLGQDGTGMIRIDAKTLATPQEGLFAGGRTASPVWRAAQGRWAATSMDRFLQGVSLTAGRDREGPYETRLFTSLADITPQPAVAADTGGGYTPAEASAEARRCLRCECMECVKVCAYLEKFGGYPKKYAREVYNNLSIVIGEHPGNTLINACSLCGLCEQVCPNDFAMQDLCLQARRTLVDKGKMPPSAHEFALMDMAFSLSDRFAMARHQPGCDTSAHAFFPGCQLCASAPGQVEAVYAHLRSTLAGGVGLLLACCGAPAHWAGRRETFESHIARLKSQWASLGHPRMILACTTCMHLFREHLPTISTVSLWSVLEGSPPSVSTPVAGRPLAVHDPCTARYDTRLQACVRRLMVRSGVSIQELALGREETECCGFGGLMQNANPDLSREVTRRRANRCDTDYITYCAMCRDNLAAAGKGTVHLLDLFFPDPRFPDPALRPRPGWSRRRENRSRLKATLLKQLWEEASGRMSTRQTIHLEISPEVADLLDRRRILEEDLQQVIQHAEAEGARLYHPPTGRYKAAYAPYKVTFWVEYSSTEKGYVVHNAYAHRMEATVP